MQLETLVFLAGVGQLCLVVVSLAIPRVLRWSDDVAQLRPLTRQVFWTYAAYIWSTNLFFGIVSVTLPSQLVSGAPIAAALSAFIAVYWGARVGIQFFYFDRGDAPEGFIFVLGEWLLVALFVALTAIYGSAAWGNVNNKTHSQAQVGLQTRSPTAEWHPRGPAEQGPAEKGSQP